MSLRENGGAYEESRSDSFVSGPLRRKILLRKLRFCPFKVENKLIYGLDHDGIAGLEKNGKRIYI